jgi:hypothetical protein
MELDRFNPWRLENFTIHPQGMVFERFSDGSGVTKRQVIAPTGETITSYSQGGQNIECTASFPSGATVTFNAEGGLMAASPTHGSINLPTADAVSAYFDGDAFGGLRDRFGIDMVELYGNMGQWLAEKRAAEE